MNRFYLHISKFASTEYWVLSCSMFITTYICYVCGLILNLIMHIDPVWIIFTLVISEHSHRLFLATVDRLDNGSCLVPRCLKSRLESIPIHSREETGTFDAV